ncbi:hypothetical protein FNT36_14325 [Hymenobacter setariae]|uniref:Ribbon-helix-helix protein, CopG family n=1 Tax=Hymenobacter setariae TaxID=2594794 RepID=A0A558BVX8_9BACT|nr:hypothetical protein [Hymenobacter setariae]TVT40641.1 hypothetical protein FNT36_14325 [Hymenobacter setariae]
MSTHVGVIIICPTHGAFEQKPNSHLQGCGCQQCGTDRIRLAQTTRIRLAQATERLKKGRMLSFTDAEYEKLAQLAKAAKLSRSEYIIDRLGLGE